MEKGQEVWVKGWETLIVTDIKSHLDKPQFTIIIRATNNTTQLWLHLSHRHSLMHTHKHKHFFLNRQTQRHTWWSWWDQKCLSGEFVAVRWEIISRLHLGAIGWLPFRDHRQRGTPPQNYTHTHTYYSTACLSVVDHQLTSKKNSCDAKTQHVIECKTETKRVEEEEERARWRGNKIDGQNDEIGRKFVYRGRSRG